MLIFAKKKSWVWGSVHNHISLCTITCTKRIYIVSVHHYMIQTTLANNFVNHIVHITNQFVLNSMYRYKVHHFWTPNAHNTFLCAQYTHMECTCHFFLCTIPPISANVVHFHLASLLHTSIANLTWLVFPYLQHMGIRCLRHPFQQNVYIG